MKNSYQIIFTFILLFSANISVAQETTVNESEIEVSAKNCQCSPENGLSVSEQFATLEHREIGSPLLDEKGDRVIWPRALPFFAQEVIDLGFELPKTFGFAVIPNVISQDLILKDLKVGLNGSEMVEMDFVKFGTARAENKNLQLKADVWLFPFLNLYATYGKMRGVADTPIAIKGQDLVEFLGGSCDGLFSPKLCDKNVSAIAKPEYTGSNISFGLTLAMGWDRFFVALPITYVITDLNILADDVKAFQVSPRIGISSDAGEWGTISTFIGMSYLDAELDVAGKITFDTSDLPGENDGTELDFIINQENADKYNYLIGFNWDVTQSWSFHSEAGFGGSRESFIASTTYRF